MFKGLGNIAGLMKQAREMQGRMSEVQERLAHLRVEGNAGGGMVVVEANGQQRILGIRIEEALLKDTDREMLEDLVVAATNQALDKAKQAAADEMGKVTGDLNLPGLEEAMAKFGLGDSPG